MTRNRLIGDEPVRGFESHPLRQKASNAFALLASCSPKPLARRVVQKSLWR